MKYSLLSGSPYVPEAVLPGFRLVAQCELAHRPQSGIELLCSHDERMFVE